jgi:hypothetical protein
MISRSAQDLNPTELLCSFILNAAGATLVAIRRRAGHDPVVIFTAKNGGPDHAVSRLARSVGLVKGEWSPLSARSSKLLAA